MGKFPRKIKAKKCCECEGIFLEDEAEIVNCFKLSDFEDMASVTTKLIEAEKVLKMQESETIDAVKCPHCDKLLDDMNIEDAEMWQCVECEETHEDKDDAYNCCG